MTSLGTDGSSELRTELSPPSPHVPAGKHLCQRQALLHHMDESLCKGLFPKTYYFDLEDPKTFFYDPVSPFPRWEKN